MEKPLLNNLIEMLQKIKTPADLPDNFFDEMINATISGVMVKLTNTGMSESDALAAIHKSFNKHMDAIMKDFRD